MKPRPADAEAGFLVEEEREGWLGTFPLLPVRNTPGFKDCLDDRKASRSCSGRNLDQAAGRWRGSGYCNSGEDFVTRVARCVWGMSHRCYLVGVVVILCWEKLSEYGSDSSSLKVP